MSAAPLSELPPAGRRIVLALIAAAEAAAHEEAAPAVVEKPEAASAEGHGNDQPDAA